MMSRKQFPTLHDLDGAITYPELLNSIIGTLYGAALFLVNGNDLNLSELFSLSQMNISQLLIDLPLELNRLGCNYLSVYISEETFDLMVSYNY